MALPEEMAEAEGVTEQALEPAQAPVLEPAREWVAVANSSWTPGSLDSRYHRNP